jgi:Holliday junction resolvase RusA-like endonuclease
MQGFAPKEPIDYPVNIQYLFYKSTRRLCDGLNLSAAMDDILTEARVIDDDHRDIVAGHDGTRVYYDKGEPRVEVIITPMNDYDRWKNG